MQHQAQVSMILQSMTKSKPIQNINRMNQFKKVLQRYLSFQFQLLQYLLSLYYLGQQSQERIQLSISRLGWKYFFQPYLIWNRSSEPKCLDQRKYTDERTNIFEDAHYEHGIIFFALHPRLCYMVCVSRLQPSLNICRSHTAPSIDFVHDISLVFIAYNLH